MSDLRVKLDLSRLPGGRPCGKIWLLIKSGTCDSIGDVKDLICRKFHLDQNANQFHVSLQDAVIPDDETVFILNSDDLLVLRENKSTSIDCLNRGPIFDSLQPTPAPPKRTRVSVTPEARTVQLSSTSESVDVEVPTATSKKKKRRKERSSCEVEAATASSPPKLRRVAQEQAECSAAIEQSATTKKRKRKIAKLPPSDDIVEDEPCRSVPLNETNGSAEQKPDSDAESLTDAQPELPATPLKKRRRKRPKRKPKTVVVSPPAVPANVGVRPMVKRLANGDDDRLKHVRFGSPGPGESGDESDQPAVPESISATVNGSISEDVIKKSPPQQKSCHFDDALTNPNEVQLGIRTITKPVLTKDYSLYPSLAGPPRNGDIIAYKVLELSESYTPEISEYKVGKVVSFDPESRQVNIEFLQPLSVKVKRGKFELLSDEELERCDEDDWGGYEAEEPPDKFEIVTNDTVYFAAMLDAKLVNG